MIVVLMQGAMAPLVYLEKFSEKYQDKETPLCFKIFAIVCFADLHQFSKINIFEPFLTILVLSVILRGSRGNSKNWLKNKF